jgi:K+-transporting ATPase ATPase A chain
MTAQGLLQIAVYIGILVALAKPLGLFMTAVYEGRRTFLSPLLQPMELGIYRLAGVAEERETGWKRYALGVLLINLVGFLVVYLLQRMQGMLPLNPQGFGAVSPDSAFNTAVSFASNTNWQGYVGESTMSYLTQMLGLAVQNFLSAATGMAVLVALIRGFARRQSAEIGNFWVDFTRSTLYVLLPLSLLLAIVLVSQGVVQSFSPYRTVELLEPITIQMPVKNEAGEAVLDAAGRAVTKPEQITEQTVPLGPAASQIAIKQLGTNGGGFFNVNSAHPLENPTPLANFLEMLAILLIPAALCYTFGRMVKDTRQGWAVMIAMLVIFVPLTLSNRPAIRSWRRWVSIRRHRRCSRAATWKARRRALASLTPRCGRR